MTPIDDLASLPKATTFLREDATLEDLQALAHVENLSASRTREKPTARAPMHYLRL